MVVATAPHAHVLERLGACFVEEVVVERVRGGRLRQHLHCQHPECEDQPRLHPEDHGDEGRCDYDEKRGAVGALLVPGGGERPGGEAAPKERGDEVRQEYKGYEPPRSPAVEVPAVVGLVDRGH
eukprot:6100798-Pleurochrysis_carterae.AAC.1